MDSKQKQLAADELAFIKAQTIVTLLDLAIAPQISVFFLRREVRRMLDDHQRSFGLIERGHRGFVFFGHFVRRIEKRDIGAHAFQHRRGFAA